MLFDLGVSSMQLDVRERGFAYAEDAPLDMRMDGTTGPTAADVLNTYSAADLTRVLREYGEERFARRIAAAVVRRREQEPFTTSARLVELLYAEIPAPARRTGGHPAKRTFQALRMEVNDELAVLRRAIPAAIDAIARRRSGGRGVLPLARGPARQAGLRRWPPAPPCPRTCRSSPRGSEPALRLVTRGAEQADEQEIAAEPTGRLGAAPRHRTHPPSPGSHRMSTANTAVAATALTRARAPFEAAVERARLSVVPHRRRVRAPRMPFVTLVSLVLLGGIVGLLCFNTRCSRPRSRPRPSRSAPPT